MAGNFGILIRLGNLTPLSVSLNEEQDRLLTNTWTGSQALPVQIKRSASEELFPLSTRAEVNISKDDKKGPMIGGFESAVVPGVNTSSPTERSNSPPPVSTSEAVNRAISLSKKLSGSNIPTLVTDRGDLMLDMKGYKSSEDDALRAEVIARKILAEELEGNYDIGALIGADEQGNLWIYSSEEAKEAAARKIGLGGLAPQVLLNDTASDPGYHTDDEASTENHQIQPKHHRTQSDASPLGLVTPPQTPPATTSGSGDPNRNYAKTLRLTSDQLKALNLNAGPNLMSFSVNRATCLASMYYWTYDVPIVISDIDGTITK